MKEVVGVDFSSSLYAEAIKIPLSEQAVLYNLPNPSSSQDTTSKCFIQIEQLCSS